MISRQSDRLSAIDVAPVTHCGLEYRWHPAAFLNRRQAKYALQQLWRLCHADENSWDRQQRLAIPAATTADVERLFATPEGELPWLPLHHIVKPGVVLDLDTTHLPGAVAIESPACGRDVDLRCDGRRLFSIDVVAFTFLMLTRWEESELPLERDVHGRIARRAMLASRQAFHQRPVVDEWGLVLGTWLRRNESDPHAALHRTARILMTHDIDHPYRFATPGHIVRHAAAELIRHSHNPIQACREFRRGWRSWRSGTGDPYRLAIDWLMDLDESLGLEGQFFFMTSSRSQFDEGYDLRQPRLQQLLAEIRGRNHKLGWHPGYQTLDDAERFGRELATFREATGLEAAGGRQHYLRWDAGTSWDRWSDSGLTFDCSVGFADCCGFRCGTSHPYPVYSRDRDCELPLIEHPLHVMDCGLYTECGDRISASKKMSEIIGRIRQVGGEAVTLIHNSFVDFETIAAMVGPLKTLQETQNASEYGGSVATELSAWPAVRRCA